MKLPTILPALAALAGCAHRLGNGTGAAGPRRHLGNLSRGGIYDN